MQRQVVKCTAGHVIVVEEAGKRCPRCKAPCEVIADEEGRTRFPLKQAQKLVNRMTRKGGQPVTPEPKPEQVLNG